MLARGLAPHVPDRRRGAPRHRQPPASTPPHPTAPAPLSRDEICARDPDVHASAVAGAAPFKPSPHDHDPDSATAPPLLARDGLCPPPPLSGLCATVDDSDPHDVCAISNENLARTLRQSRGSHGAPGPWAAWDGTTPPQYLDRIDAHLHPDARRAREAPGKRLRRPRPPGLRELRERLPRHLPGAAPAVRRGRPDPPRGLPRHRARPRAHREEAAEAGPHLDAGEARAGAGPVRRPARRDHAVGPRRVPRRREEARGRLRLGRGEGKGEPAAERG